MTKTLLKKLLGLALLSTFAAMPLTGANTAQASQLFPHHRKHHLYAREHFQKFSGRVTKVNRPHSEFDLRVGGKIYNVYLSSRVPRRLSRNDAVRVYGYRYGRNDIRTATVTIVHNR
ncbi:MAG: hypothetical protein ABI210_07770 [Abditibacteriaceae bacterium]